VTFLPGKKTSKEGKKTPPIPGKSGNDLWDVAEGVRAACEEPVCSPALGGSCGYAVLLQQLLLCPRRDTTALRLLLTVPVSLVPAVGTVGTQD